MADAVREVLRAEPDLQAEELDKARREALRVQRSSLVGLRRDGVISEEVYEKLSQEIDAVLIGERLYSPAGQHDTSEVIRGSADMENN